MKPRSRLLTGFDYMFDTVGMAVLDGHHGTISLVQPFDSRLPYDPSMTGLTVQKAKNMFVV